MTHFAHSTNVLRRSGLLLAAFALAATATAAYADPLPIVNGGFEDLLNPGVSSEFGTAFPSQQVTGWTTSGYNFVFTPGTADTTGADSQFGNLQLWGPGNGSSNGLPASSPLGGNYIAADGAFNQAAISQVISGLVIGQTYDVVFYYAGAQQHGFNGPNTEQWQVSFGGQTQSTPVLLNGDEGFTGWQQADFVFTADGTSDTLSFLAVGTPSGVPPFSLLDGVSVAPTPEPGSLALLATGLFGVGGVVRSRFKKVAA